ncbi:MAG: hypothetical protein HC881_16635 [Leptolyngbyaceae cyanobacterium SL_7_1]|nr:hypothetical protein [Leptolyngbyaceae cyanobacterium SL_7_1]
MANRFGIALTAATLLLGNIPPIALATPEPLQISQRYQDWNAVLHMARLVNARSENTGLVLQLDVLDKPETTYANAIYQVFARHNNGRWTEVYTNLGARLVASPAGRLTLPPEVILLSDIREQLGRNVNWSNVELRSVVRVRYDLRGGRRNRETQWESVQTYTSLTQTTAAQVEQGNIITVSRVGENPDRVGARPRPANPPANRPQPSQPSPTALIVLIVPINLLDPIATTSRVILALPCCSPALPTPK